MAYTFVVLHVVVPGLEESPLALMVKQSFAALPASEAFLNPALEVSALLHV